MPISTPIAVSERLQRDAVQVIESSIPVALTLDEWRRLRPRKTRRRVGRRPSRTPRAARHLTLVPEVSRSEDPPLLAA
jgi:hypothetical protein